MSTIGLADSIRLKSKNKNLQPYIKYCLIALPALLYLFISLLYFAPGGLSDFTKEIFVPGGDPYIMIWSLNWWTFSLGHHLNPFITHYIWYPSGFNLAWATSLSSVALLLAPITLLGSAQLTFNLLVILSPALSAIACFYLVKYVTKDYLASLFAGYMFGFSSYQLGQMLGHTNLYLTFAIPLFVLLYLLRLDKKISKAWFIGLNVLLVVFQFGLSNEVLATFAFFCVIAIGLQYWFATKKQRKAIINIFRELAWALVISGIALSPYLFYIAKGYSSTPAVLNSPFLFSSDLSNFIVPTQVTKIGGSLFAHRTLKFSGNYSEDGAYLGLPTVIIMGYFLFKYRARRYVKVVGLTLIILFICTLGTKLRVYGFNTGLRMPWDVLDHVPILKSGLPDRFTLYISLIASIIVGLWLAIKTTPAKARLKYAAALVIVISLLPNLSMYNWGVVKTPIAFSSRYLTKNENIIVLPYGYLGNSMYYQYTSKMRFTQSGGYIGYTPPTIASNKLVQSLYSGKPDANFKQELMDFCQDNKVKAIIYTPDTSPALISAINSANWPEVQTPGAIIVKVPSSIN